QDYVTDLAVDAAGNVHVTGGSRITSVGTHDDYATVKYHTSGDTDWIRRYNSPSEENAGLPDWAVDIAATDSKVYVTGNSTRNKTGLDFTTIRYNADGSQRWIRHYDGESNKNDMVQAMTVDKAGHVYVTGISQGSQSNNDIATIAYDDNGNTRWIRRFEGTGFDEFASDIAVDSYGNVYVTGWTHTNSINTSNRDYVTIKHDRNGNILWVRRYNGPGNSADQAIAIALDALGNVYVTGESIGNGTGTDYATIKYSTNGTQLWVARYNGLDNSLDNARALAVDHKGNVYVTGGSSSVGAGQDYATIKYNTHGVQQWAAINENGFAASNLAVDAANNVFVTGEPITVKYNAAGVQQWEITNPLEANDLAVDNEGNVYITGTSYTAETNEDYATVKYDGNGLQQWLMTYIGPGNWIDEASALALDEEGNVYITGGSTGAGTDEDFATIKYVQTINAITRTKEKPEPAELTMEQNFRISHTPNPVVTNTNIQYVMPENGHVSIILYDVMGRQVSTLVNAAHKAGSYSINYDASRLQKGTYYFQIRANTQQKKWVQTHKMSVMR
ncbi:MAG TPA: SBBP repeat-containing protein, partial [Flavisolibacter sp.]|nr:SBBP repeat-containing protein [Flavisolibacter sp.]